MASTNTYLLLLLIYFMKEVISANQLYKQMTFPSTVWPAYVYQETNVAKTLVECGAMCSSNSECEGFYYAGPEVCKLADLERNSNIIGTQTATSMYVNLGKPSIYPFIACLLSVNRRYSCSTYQNHSVTDVIKYGNKLL